VGIRRGKAYNSIAERRSRCLSTAGFFRRTLIDQRSFAVSPTQFCYSPEGEEMKSMKTYVAAAIAVSAVVATVPVVNAQQATAAASPAANRAANRELGKRVEAALYKQKGMDWGDVHAIARGGKVYLVGMVPNQPQIDLAGKVAEGVSGVTSVQNNLTVEEVGH
jgi:osmotically-inducible protein OsmY